MPPSCIAGYFSNWMRPPESFSTFSIHGTSIERQTLEPGAMKVWNFSVTVCCACAPAP